MMSNTTPPNPITPPKSKKWGRIFLLLLIVFIAGLATFNYYLWQYLSDIKEQVKQQTTPLNEKIADLRQQLGNLPQQDLETQPFVESLQKVEKQVVTLAQQQQQLQTTIQLLAQQPRYRADWLLAEVVYLLTIANQRLVLVADLEGALTALTLAEERLQQLNNPAVLSIRKQLTADVDSLRKVKSPDIGGFAIQLTNYIAQVEKLPLLQRQHQIATKSVNKVETDSQRAEKPLVETIWQEVKQLVVIRYNANVDTGFLTAEQSDLISQNLRLQLESARLALLRHDSKSLLAAIKIAQRWLDRYYDQRNNRVEKIQVFLSQLKKLELNPALPDISATLHHLQQLIEQTSSSITRPNEAIFDEKTDEETQ
jgi:uroporphyrin-3 C-methyltransferase